MSEQRPQKAQKMQQQPDLQSTFKELKSVLKKYEPQLVVQAETRGNYSLATPYSQKHKKEVFFGAVKINKNYVSYHLMPVYVFPTLLDGVSAGLRRRMQGKSCFNFKRIDTKELEELTGLTKRCFLKFKKGKLVD